MEFWGIEVKPGKPTKVEAEEHTLLHISQASLGDCKGKKEEFVPLYVKVDNQKFVLGTLSTENIPQLSCDLVFEKDFELSHNWGKGSVYFTGYRTPNIDDIEGLEDFSDSEEEEEEEVEVAANGNAAKTLAKPKAKPAEVKKDVEAEEDDSDSEDGMDEDDSEEEEETPTPKKSSKKRANEDAPKTPVSAKKAKAAVTPQKTEEKKKGGPATPHPAKKGGKTPATATQSPKSASQVSCGSCKKTFNSENALESHNKAKHSAAK